MGIRGHRILAATLLLLHSGASALAASYTGVLLAPASQVRSYANGASNTNQVGYGSTSNSLDTEHAFLWTDTAASVVDLNPPGFTYSGLRATDGSTNKHIGYGGSSATGGAPHALLWTGTSNTPTDLQPTSGFSFTYGLDISGTRQVGYGGVNSTGNHHALMWTGTAASVVDLHPTGFNESEANGTNGTKELGIGVIHNGTSSTVHAVLWTGTTAASAVDLNPTGFTNTYAYGLSTKIQVGYGTGTATGGADHALLWTDTAPSKVDLHPATGFSASYALSTNDANQVGYGVTTTGGNDHALLWTGTAGSVVDLHSLLASTGITFVKSRAMHIAPDGDIVGYGRDAANKTYAVMWQLAAGVPGDYNNNGVVDAADYVTWRNGTNPLTNEVTTTGQNTPEDYTAWRARFGKSAGSGSSLDSPAIPEPNTCVLALLAIITSGIHRNR